MAFTSVYTFVLQRSNSVSDCLPVLSRFVLPVAHTGIPPELVKSPGSPGSQGTLIDPASIGGVIMHDRFTHDQFIHGNSSAGDFLDGGAGEGSLGCSGE